MATLHQVAFKCLMIYVPRLDENYDTTGRSRIAVFAENANRRLVPSAAKSCVASVQSTCYDLRLW